MTTVVPRQALNFELIRSGQLNRSEIAVLAFINTYSTFCAPPSLRVMAQAMMTSERTLRRTINSLTLKGIIKKTYRCFKRLRLEIVSLATQASLVGPGMLTKALRNSIKKKWRGGQRPKTTGLIRPPVTEPIQNKDLKNKTIPESSNFDLKTGGLGPNKSVEDQVAELLTFMKARRPAF